MRSFVWSAPASGALAGVFFLLGLPLYAEAQSEATIRGRVVAAADRSPVIAAAVTLTSSADVVVTATTDDDGRFVFQLVPPGRYTLSASAEGFAPRTAAVVVEAREVQSLTLALDLGRIESRVEVAAPAPALSTHSPASTTLTAETLDAAAPAERQRLTDAIVAAAPGMIRGHDDFVHVRGHEVALVPILNGVAFWENPHALFSPGISPAVIDRVSVVTGAFPAEYGNRFGGVLDIVTKSGTRMHNDGSFAASIGEAGRRRVEGEFGSHRGRLGIYVFGSGFESNRFLSPPHPRAVHDSGRAGSLFAQVDGNLGAAGSLRVLMTGDGARYEIPVHPRDLELRPGATSVQRTRQQSAVVSWMRATSETALTASVYERWSDLRLSAASDPYAAVASQRRALFTLGGKMDVTRAATRHMVKMGVDMVGLRPDERVFYDYSGYRAFTHFMGWPHIHLPGVVDFARREAGGQFSAYVQDAVTFGDRLSAHVGLRVDRYDLLIEAAHVSPRVNVAIAPGPGWTVHASYNRFFVPPPIEGVLMSSSGLTAAIEEIGVPLPALEPTVEDQFEAAVSRDAGPLRVTVAGYRRASDNPVHTTVWPDSRVYAYASFDRARAYGLETKLTVRPLGRSGVSGYLNYALGRVDFYNPVTGGFVTDAGHLHDTTRFPAPMDQRHTVTGGAMWRHERTGVFAGTSLSYGSGTPMGHGGGDHSHGDDGDHAHAPSDAAAARVPDHLLANVSVGIDLLRGSAGRGRLRVRFDAENVGNRSYLIAQEGEFSPAQYSPPRLVSLSVQVGF